MIHNYCRDLTAFDPILPARVKSKPQDEGGIFVDLTDLTDSLGRHTCARVWPPARTLALASLSPQNIGQISQIPLNCGAVLWFGFDSGQSNAGQTGGQIEVSVE